MFFFGSTPKMGDGLKLARCPKGEKIIAFDIHGKLLISIASFLPIFYYFLLYLTSYIFVYFTSFTIYHLLPQVLSICLTYIYHLLISAIHTFLSRSVRGKRLPSLKQTIKTTFADFPTYFSEGFYHE